MNTDFDRLPEPLLHRANEVCNKFETAWKQGHRPSIRDFLDQAPGLDRQALLRLLIPLDVDYRRLDGECPTDAEYCEAFPDDVSTIRDIFAAYVPESFQSPSQTPPKSRGSPIAFAATSKLSSTPLRQPANPPLTCWPDSPTPRQSSLTWRRAPAPDRESSRSRPAHSPIAHSWRFG